MWAVLTHFFRSAASQMARASQTMMVSVSLSASVVALLVLSVYLFGYSGMTDVWKAIYFVLFMSLFYCAVAYQINRLGAAMRGYADQEAGGQDGLAPLALDAPTITVLVPSYKEEPRVLRMTVLSAALARYANRRIVVLIDDPPHSDSVDQSLATVVAAREMLAEPMAVLRRERQAWLVRRAAGVADLSAETRRLVGAYRGLSVWLDTLAKRLEAEVSDDFLHVDRFFIDSVVRSLAEHYRQYGRALSGRLTDLDAVGDEYERLARVFCSEISSFERKRYANLSHAANKAMNLNSFIGLMGGAYDVIDLNGVAHLEATARPDADFVVEASKYVLTLDADSVILPSYMLELTGIIERDDGIGVVQTPYLTFPNSSAPVERIAGATTDIQYLVHQGSSHFNAAFWVGANALLRVSALDAIHAVEVHDGLEVDVYIQDATVIEDTGSTIDLLDAGWRVHNHFKALAYSATPADFGSLAIQRQRWSNGGLIILPKLLEQFWSGRGRVGRLAELALRTHYLLSPVIGNAAVFALMIVVSVEARHMALAPLAMVPYFLLYGLDLRRMGYRFRDVLGVSALNLILLPVGFAGVFASLRQMMTGRKGAFARTPKVAGRTAVAAFYVLFNFAMLALMIRYVVEGVLAGDLLASAVPALSMLLYGFGIGRFIGWRNGVADVWLAVVMAVQPAIASVGRFVADKFAAAGRVLAHPLPRVAGVAMALLVGLSPVTFGSADSVRRAQSAGGDVVGALAVQVAPNLVIGHPSAVAGLSATRSLIEGDSP